MSNLVRWRLPRARPAPLRQPVLYAPPAGPLETPQTIPNLGIWLDATKITGLAGGAAVSQWDDASGNGNHATQATGTAQPSYQTAVQNGLPVVRFDGTSDFLSLATAGALAMVNAVSGLTVAFVGASTSPNGTTRTVAAWSMSALNSGVRAVLAQRGASSPMNMGGRRTDGQAFQSASSATLLVSGVWNAWTGVLDYANTDALVYKGDTLDGSNLTFQDAGTTAATDSLAATVGSLPTGAVEFWAGDIGELIVYKRALTAIEVDTLADYLTAKWGFAGGPTPISVSDSGQFTGTETVSLQATLTASDSTEVTGTDTPAVAATLSAADATEVTGAEAVALAAAATVTDSTQATGADNVTVGVPIPVADAGQLTGTETPASSTALSAGDTGTLTGAETVALQGPAGAPDAILASTNLTGIVQEVWDDPEAPAGDFLDATNAAAATDVRFSFPTPSTAPGSGGPTRFQVWVARTNPGGYASGYQGGYADAAPNPTVVIDLWESGSFVRQLTSETVTSMSGQLVIGDLNPAELSDPSGAGVELRIRGVPT